MPTDPFGIPPAPPQTGISGIGVRRSQGGQPRGIGEALGYGLMGASDIAQEALPGFIQSAGHAQNASQAFAGGVGIGLLGSLGAPGRAAVQQQEKHEKATQDFQAHVIQSGMRYMDSASIEKLFKGVGLGDLKTKPEKLNLAMYNQSVRALIAAYLRKGQSKENIKELGDTLRQIPDLADLMANLEVEPTGLSPYEQARRVYTNASMAEFQKTGDPSVLVPAAEPSEGTDTETLSKYKLNQFKKDRAEMERVARERGYVNEDGKLNLDAAREEVFAGDSDRAAMYDTVTGKSSATPKTSFEQAMQMLNTSDWTFKYKPIAEQRRIAKEQAQLLDEEKAATPMSPRAAGYRPPKQGEILSPQSRSGNSPEAAANRSATLKGLILTEYGMLPPGTPLTLSAINGIWNSQDAEFRAQLDEAARSAAQTLKERKKYVALSPEGLQYLERVGAPFEPGFAIPGQPPDMGEDEQTMVQPLPGEDEMGGE